MPGTIAYRLLTMMSLSSQRLLFKPKKTKAAQPNTGPQGKLSPTGLPASSDPQCLSSSFRIWAAGKGTNINGAAAQAMP